MNLDCPTCHKKIYIADDLAGQRLNCPGCGTSVQVSDDQLVKPSDVWLDSDEDELEQDTARQKAATKTCPMCGETVTATAVTCRYCGEHFSVHVGADSRSGHGIWRAGNQLVMSKHAQLPFVCVKTNQPADDWLRRKLYWHSPLLYFLILFGCLGIFLYIIISLIVRKTADINVGLCSAQFKRRRRAIAGGWICAVVGCVLIVVAVVSGGKDETALGIAVIGSVPILAGLLAGLLMARVVVASRITDDYVRIKGVNPAYLASLPPFPGER